MDAQEVEAESPGDRDGQVTEPTDHERPVNLGARAGDTDRESAGCNQNKDGKSEFANGRAERAGRRKRSATRQSSSQSRRNENSPYYGALDLGTNNCRLLVARPTRRGFLVVDAFSRIIRLGEGVSKTGVLSDQAMDRTIDALRICSNKMTRRHVKRSRVIATEACRMAMNSADFIDRVHSEAGLKLEIVTRETEAKLAVSGCASLLDRSCDWALVFDIGGGSSELILLDLTNRKRKWRRSLYDRLEAQECIAAWTSLPVGVVTLAELYGGRDVSHDVFERMVGHVGVHLKTFESQHQILGRLREGSCHLLGTSGTVTTLAGIHLGLPSYDRNRVDGCWLQIAEIRDVTESLISMDYEDRIAQPCIGADRADLVLAGCAILEAILRAWPCDRLRVADRGLREGILATLMAEDGLLRGGGSKRSG